MKPKIQRYLFLPIFLFLFEFILSQAANKLSQANQLKDEHGIVILDPKTIYELVFTNDKPYHVLLFFTTSNEKAGCVACKKIEQQIVTATKQWKSFDKSDRLIFAKYEIFNDLEIPKKFGIKLIPEVFFIPPTSSEYTASSLDLRQIDLEQSRSASYLLNMIKRLMGHNVDIDKKFNTIPLSVLFYTLISGYIVYLYAKTPSFRPLMNGLIKYSAIVYVVLMGSGFMWAKINNPAYFDEDPKNKNLILFNSNIGADFGVESHIIFITYSLIAFTFVFLTKFAPTFDDRELKIGSMLISVVMLLFLNGYLYSSFSMKMPSYPFRILLP